MCQLMLINFIYAFKVYLVHLEHSMRHFRDEQLKFDILLIGVKSSNTAWIRIDLA